MRAVWGVIAFQNLPIDAYPDLAPPRVQIVTQWPGHAAEEVEREADWQRARQHELRDSDRERGEATLRVEDVGIPAGTYELPFR